MVVGGGEVEKHFAVAHCTQAKGEDHCLRIVSVGERREKGVFKC